MGFQANVLKVMIASPGDVAIERELVTQELYRWNNANAVSRKLMLQPSNGRHIARRRWVLIRKIS